MKCQCCDKLLSDYETNRKIVREDESVEYPDMCNKCFTISDLSSIVPIVERSDLVHLEDTEDDFSLEDVNSYSEYIEDR